jgi:hypothetical protein
MVTPCCYAMASDSVVLLSRSECCSTHQLRLASAASNIVRTCCAVAATGCLSDSCNTATVLIAACCGPSHA